MFVTGFSGLVSPLAHCDPALVVADIKMNLQETDYGGFLQAEVRWGR